MSMQLVLNTETHRLTLVSDAHLAHCLLPVNTLAKRPCKSLGAELPTLIYSGLISKPTFHSIKSNNLVTLKLL